MRSQRDRKNFEAMFAAVSMLLLCAACGKAQSDAPLVMAEVPVLRINTSEGTYGGPAATLGGLFASQTGYQLAFSGILSGVKGWGAATRPKPEDIVNGSGTIELVPDGDLEGQGRVWTGPSPQMKSLAGTLKFTLTQGHIAGSVTGANPSSLNATFDGKLGVGCTVLASTLPPEPGTGGVAIVGDSSGEILAADRSLQSPQCAPLSQWASP